MPKEFERFLRKKEPQPILEHTLSEEIFNTGRWKCMGSVLNLNTDPKIPALVKETKDFIRNNKLILPRDEEKLAEFIITKIHSDQYYGTYDKKAIEMLTQASALRELLNYQLEIYPGLPKGSEDRKMVSETIDRYTAETKTLRKEWREYYDDRCIPRKGNLHTEDFKKDTLVCREQAFIAAYVMHSVGMPSDLLYGTDASGQPHAFLQLHSTGARIEATVENEAYFKPVGEAQRLADGKIGYFFNSDLATMSISGSGMESASTRYGWFKKDENLMVMDNVQADYVNFVDRAKQLAEPYIKRVEKGIEVGRVRVEDAQLASSLVIISQDKKYTAAAQLAGNFAAAAPKVEDLGLVQGEKNKLAEWGVRDIQFNISELINFTAAHCKTADANKDGYLTPTEIPALFERASKSR